ncbi:20221_t:CDS:2 [Funneliformis geosporum]|nr:20221_t:CDS:2 [Funneliformis geosporum]
MGKAMNIGTGGMLAFFNIPGLKDMKKQDLDFKTCGGAFHEATPEELQARRESLEGKYDYLTGATQGAGYKANLELKKKINAFVFGEKKRSGGREKPQWVKAY